MRKSSLEVSIILKDSQDQHSSTLASKSLSYSRKVLSHKWLFSIEMASSKKIPELDCSVVSITIAAFGYDINLTISNYPRDSLDACNNPLIGAQVLYYNIGNTEFLLHHKCHLNVYRMQFPPETFILWKEKNRRV